MCQECAKALRIQGWARHAPCLPWPKSEESQVENHASYTGAPQDIPTESPCTVWQAHFPRRTSWPRIGLLIPQTFIRETSPREGSNLGFRFFFFSVLHFFIEVKFTGHEINHLKLYNSMDLFIHMLCSRHLYLVPKHFHHPKRKASTH